MSSDDHDTMLQQYLASRGEPCPSCSYDLRGLRGHRCPECGQALRLHVGLESPNLAAFVVGLVGLAAALGFSGLLLLFIAYVIAFESRAGIEGDDILLLFAELVVSGLLTVVWTRAGHWVRRQTGRARWGLAALCWVVPVVSLGLFIVVVGP